MDLKRIDRAVGAYLQDAEPSDAARLRFFRGLFELQQERCDELAGDGGAAAAAVEGLDEAYLSARPLLQLCPVAIEAGDFAATCRRIAAYMAAEAGLAEDVAQALGAIDWDGFSRRADLVLAGTDPSGFVEAVRADEGMAEPFGVAAGAAVLVLAFAVRTHVQAVAESLMGAVSADAKEGNHARPLRCPVCGAPASLSHVGVQDTLQGGARSQFCSACGTTWNFERIRCGSCGSQDQGNLHYHHLDGDPAHRLQTCDACGSYQRVVFQDDLRVPACLDVEDVVMAKLDRVALDPRFHRG